MIPIRPEFGNKAGVFLQCTYDALGAIRRPKAWAFALPMLLLAGGWLFVLASFPRPPADFALIPAMRGVGGDLALRYPEAFAYLPRIASWGAPWVVWLVGVPLLAHWVRSLPFEFSDSDPDRMPEAPRPSVGAALFAMLPVAMVSSFSLMAADLLYSASADPREEFIRAILQVGALGFGILGRMLLAFTLPAVVLGTLGFAAAVQRSASLCARYLGITAGLIVTETLLSAPLRLSPFSLMGFLDQLTPEASFWITGFGLLGAVLGSMFLAAAGTRLYLHRYGMQA